MTILNYAENAWDKIHDPFFTKNIQKWKIKKIESTEIDPSIQCQQYILKVASQIRRIINGESTRVVVDDYNYLLSSTYMFYAQVSVYDIFTIK